MGAVNIDLSEFPLVVFDCYGKMTEAEIDVHLREYRALLDRNEPYLVVMDARRLEAGDAKIRKTYANFLATNAADLRRLCRSCAFIVTSPMMMGAITAILWFTPLPFPHKVFSNFDDGKGWLKRLL